MNTLIFENETIQIPAWVNDHANFRRWALSDAFPESGRICYLDQGFWVDVSKEQFFSHNQVKNEFNLVVGGLVKKNRLGRYIPDGMLLSNTVAEFTTQPDGAFVSHASLKQGRVKLVPGTSDGFVELEGVPDMVLEVVSNSSVLKDTVTLVDQYGRAGIPEYWLVDARGERLEFDIFRMTPDGFLATRKQAGWLKSQVFGKSFLLTRRLDDSENPEYTLSVR
jgi:Uma2 family endonuclease